MYCQAKEKDRVTLSVCSAVVLCMWMCAGVCVCVCKIMTVTTGLAGTAAATTLLHNPSQVAC